MFFIFHKFFSIVRYRFFFFAGIFPYLLGQVMAFNSGRAFNWSHFGLGFLGILLVLIGVELFNEYFDAKDGGDRIFSQQAILIPHHFFPLGVSSFFLAFLIGLYFTFQAGWPILIFSFLGFLAAYFYVGPPFKWAYRGLGELVIALSYGPFMMLGSYYLQTKMINFAPIFVSLICGLSIFCLTILNEIPDFYQDRLIGKRNLVVKLGRRNAVKISLLSFICIFILLSLGIVLKQIPLLVSVVFLIFPWGLKSLLIASKNYEKPKVFIYPINVNLTIYILIIFFLGVGYL